MEEFDALEDEPLEEVPSYGVRKPPAKTGSKPPARSTSAEKPAAKPKAEVVEAAEAGREGAEQTGKRSRVAECKATAREARGQVAAEIRSEARAETETDRA